MVICAGEILADMIGREENGLVCCERYAGGAPFNVACGLKNWVRYAVFAKQICTAFCGRATYAAPSPPPKRERTRCGTARI